MSYIRWSLLFAAVAALAACTPFLGPRSPDGGDAKAGVEVGNEDASAPADVARDASLTTSIDSGGDVATGADVASGGDVAALDGNYPEATSDLKLEMVAEAPTSICGDGIRPHPRSAILARPRTPVLTVDAPATASSLHVAATARSTTPVRSATMERTTGSRPGIAIPSARDA